MSVTRQTIADRISSSTGIKTKDANNLVDGIISAIKDSVCKGEDVLISGFGKFVVMEKEERMGRNPQTGEAVKISARKVLKFRPSDLMKTALMSKMD